MPSCFGIFCTLCCTINLLRKVYNLTSFQVLKPKAERCLPTYRSPRWIPRVGWWKLFLIVLFQVWDGKEKSANQKNIREVSTCQPLARSSSTSSRALSLVFLKSFLLCLHTVEGLRSTFINYCFMINLLNNKHRLHENILGEKCGVELTVIKLKIDSSVQVKWFRRCPRSSRTGRTPVLFCHPSWPPGGDPWYRKRGSEAP